MIQIRQGVFETNSSSTHAISIAKFSETLCIPETVRFTHDHEFGWEQAIYNDYENKAAYLWVAVCSQYDGPEDEDRLLEIKIKITDILTNAGVKSVIFQEANYVTSQWNAERTYLDIGGYIDHTEDLDGWIDDLLDEPELLLGYLFNPDSQVETGNDNDDEGVSFTLNAVYTLYKGN